MPRYTFDNPGPRRRPAGPWRSGPIPVIGVIGGIGAGKSQVAAVLGNLSRFLLDADKIGHTLLEQNPCRDRVLARFGEDILTPFGEFGVRRKIDRRALGKLAFARPEALRDLEAILHPAMRKTFEKAIARESRRNRVAGIILDAAILYEAGWDTLCDLIVFVDASPEVRMARLESSRGWTLDVLEAREKAQGPLEEKRRQADHVLINEGTLEELEATTQALWGRLIGPRRRSRGPALPESAPASRGEPPS